jgi:citrate lyase subunit beta/citryl-CoA lyase
MLKAPKYGADALVFDLEDSVAVAKKAGARGLVREAIRELAGQRPALFVRLNGWGSGFLLHDVLETFGPGVTGYLLPKTDSVRDIHALDLVLGELERETGVAVGSTEIVPLPETAHGIYKLFDICMASSRIRMAAGGSSAVKDGDTARALGIEVSQEGSEMIYFGAFAVLSLRAAGVTQVLGGMTVDLEDLDLVRRVAIRARAMGSTGSLCIHPTHVPILNEVFAPSSEDIQSAKSLVRAMAEAVDDGFGAVRYGDRMIDYAHVRSSLDLLERARQLGADIGDLPHVAVPGYNAELEPTP